MSEITASAQARELEKVVTKKRGSKKDVSSDPSLNMDELRELATLVDEHGLNDFEFENENIRVRMSKMTSPPVVQQTAAPVHVATPATPAPAKTDAEQIATAPAASADEDLVKITSPIVGTFYRSPGPDKEAYVKEG